MQDFVISHRVCRIQRWAKARYAVKRKAAAKLVSFVRSKLACALQNELRRHRLRLMRERTAINRIADLHKNLKAKKVAASMALQSQPLYEKI